MTFFVVFKTLNLSDVILICSSNGSSVCVLFVVFQSCSGGARKRRGIGESRTSDPETVVLKLDIVDPIDNVTGTVHWFHNHHLIVLM